MAGSERGNCVSSSTSSNMNILTSNLQFCIPMWDFLNSIASCSLLYYATDLGFSCCSLRHFEQAHILVLDTHAWPLPLRVCVGSLQKLPLPERAVEMTQTLAINVRTLCVDTLFHRAARGTVLCVCVCARGNLLNATLWSVCKWIEIAMVVWPLC